MATGTVIVFEEAKAIMLNADQLSTNVLWTGIFDNTVAPTAATPTPVKGDFTEVGTAGSYATNGISSGTLTSHISEAGGTMTFDTAEADPTWTANGSNDTDAWWGILHNVTFATKHCWLFVELGGPVNMATGALTISWHADGMFTII